MHTFEVIAGGLLLLTLCLEPDADLLHDLAQIRLLQPVAPAHLSHHRPEPRDHRLDGVGQVEAGLLDTELLTQEHPLPIRKDALDVERGPGLVAPRVAVARVRRRGREADLPRRVVWAAPLV